ncbi:ABC transporter permease [Bacillus sp. BGMRC 2118]|nr:ABC transporter permease [Bacillus sp. BGMRC 2118]
MKCPNLSCSRSSCSNLTHVFFTNFIYTWYNSRTILNSEGVMTTSKLLLRLSISYLLLCIFIVAFILLPREPQYISQSQFHHEVKYDFSIEAYKKKLIQFYTYVIENKGFGKAPEGITYLELLQRYTSRSLHLIIPAFFLSLTISFMYCIIEMRRRISTNKQNLSNPFGLLFTLPDFFIFILVQYVFITLGNMYNMNLDLFGNDRWFHFILPSIILSLYPMYYLSKVMMTILMKEMQKDYITTARAKGTINSRIIRLHMLRNSLRSILSHVFISFIYLVSSLPIIELLSAYDGLGYQLIQAIKGYDDLKAITFVIPFISIIFIVKLLVDVIWQFMVGAAEGGDTSRD